MGNHADTSDPSSSESSAPRHAHIRFVFDARYVRSDYPDGITRYSVELGNALSQLTPLTLLVSDVHQLDHFPGVSDYIMSPDPESVRELWSSSLIEGAGGADIVFSPLQTLGGLRRRFKLILTIHDLTYHRFREAPEDLRLRTRILWLLYHLSYMPQRLVLRRADAVVTVSNTTSRLIEQHRLTRRPPIVVPNAPRDFGERRVLANERKLADLVYVGSLAKHKDPETLIAGMAYLTGRTLHIASRASPRRLAQLRKAVPAGASVMFHNGVSDETYVTLLTSGALLVSATLDEGFCLPAVEALSLGVPCVLSDIPVLHEVAGPGALYFPARRPRAFADAVIALDDTATRSRLAASGHRHVSQFTWMHSAQALLSEALKLVER